MKKIRTAIVGAGKMGGIHAKVYSKLDDVQLVAIVDMDLQRAQNLAALHNCLALSDPKELLGKVDAVTISAPTVAHKDLAELFISNRIPVLIENRWLQFRRGPRIVELSKKYNTVVAVGHSERCNPVVQAMKRLHIEPMFIESRGSVLIRFVRWISGSC
jgi:predicted dehydrogenase